MTSLLTYQQQQQPSYLLLPTSSQITNSVGYNQTLSRNCNTQIYSQTNTSTNNNAHRNINTFYWQCRQKRLLTEER